jgi:hypothetical protein
VDFVFVEALAAEQKPVIFSSGVYVLIRQFSGFISRYSQTQFCQKLINKQKNNLFFKWKGSLAEFFFAFHLFQ